MSIDLDNLEERALAQLKRGDPFLITLPATAIMEMAALIRRQEEELKVARGADVIAARASTCADIASMTQVNDGMTREEISATVKGVFVASESAQIDALRSALDLLADTEGISRNNLDQLAHEEAEKIAEVLADHERAATTAMKHPW